MRKFNSTVNVVALIDKFKDMADRGTLLTGSGISQEDLLMQIIGTIILTSSYDTDIDKDNSNNTVDIILE